MILYFCWPNIVFSLFHIQLVGNDLYICYFCRPKIFTLSHIFQITSRLLLLQFQYIFFFFSFLSFLLSQKKRRKQRLSFLCLIFILHLLSVSGLKLFFLCSIPNNNQSLMLLFAGLRFPAANPTSGFTVAPFAASTSKTSRSCKATPPISSTSMRPFKSFTSSPAKNGKKNYNTIWFI